MNFHNQTNLRRIDRILETLDHIGVSAKSNRATADDLRQIFRPVTAKMAALDAIEPPASRAPQNTEAPAASSVGWASVGRLEDRLEGLTATQASMLVSLAMIRIDEALHQGGHQ